MQNVAHMADVLVVTCWFMMRETEMANANRNSLDAASNARAGLACTHFAPSTPWRATSHAFAGGGAAPDSHFCPDSMGVVPSKYAGATASRTTIQAARVPVHAMDAGQQTDRFGGHVARVSRAQFLATNGIPVMTNQVLGRWSSKAVERYVQTFWGRQADEVVSTCMHRLFPARL